MRLNLAGPANGAQVPVCGDRCAKAALIVLYGAKKVPGLPGHVHECLHCGWCGALLAEAERGCVWHPGDSCPGVTHASTVFAAEVARALDGTIDDDQFEQMVDLMLEHMQRRGFVDPSWVVDRLKPPPDTQ